MKGDSSRLVHVTVIVIAPHEIFILKVHTHLSVLQFCCNKIFKAALKRLINFQLSKIKTIFFASLLSV